MSAPTTLAKVKAALKRHVPPIAGWLSDTSSLGKERDTAAFVMARVNDAVEGIFAESFPDTTTNLIERWEKVARVASRPADTLTQRRNRVLSVLRRVNGPDLVRLAATLSQVLDATAAQITFGEQLRATIEAALTLTTGVIAQVLPAVAPGYEVKLGKAWPGVVDEMGVRIYLALSAVGVVSATLWNPACTKSWAFVPSSVGRWYENKTTFLGDDAGGDWKLLIYDTSGTVTLTEFRLLVSNDVDSSQIYKFYAFRDYALGGAPDVVEAQRQFNRYALAHMKAFVAERTHAVMDDIHTRLDREPMGV